MSFNNLGLLLLRVGFSILMLTHGYGKFLRLFEDKIKSNNNDESTGIQIINKALEAPLRTIVENSGGEGSVVISKVLEGNKNFGYDAKEGKFVDMLKNGIIDPKKVARVALENAASVAGMILTTECALIDIKEEAPPQMPPMGGGGMPGMM